jgi:hypothetical protein
MEFQQTRYTQREWLASRLYAETQNIVLNTFLPEHHPTQSKGISATVQIYTFAWIPLAFW